MGILYVAALIVGAVANALQILLGGDAKGGDVHVGDAHVGGAHVAGAHVGADHVAAHSEPGFLPIFLSLRFWVFGLLAFGMTGTLLHYLELAGRTLTALAAVSLGVLSGFVASFALRLIARHGDDLERLGRRAAR